MARCRHCGETNENSAAACKNCGRDLAIKCPVCGRVFKWEIPVCPVCLWDFTSDGTSYPFAGEMDLAAVREKIETARRKYKSSSPSGEVKSPTIPKTNTEKPSSALKVSTAKPVVPKTAAPSGADVKKSAAYTINTAPKKRPRRKPKNKPQPKAPSRIFTVILWVITVYVSFELMGMMAYGGAWSVSKVKSGGINLAAWSLFALLLALFLGKRARRVMQNVLIFAMLAVSAAVLIKGYSSDAGFIGRNIYTNAVQQMLSYRNEPLAMEDEETAEFIKSLTGKDEIRAYDVLFIHTVKTEGKNFVLGYSTKYFSNIVDLDISGAQQFRFNTAYMTNIRKLTLDNTKWGDENLKSIETYTLPNLVYFSAKNCGISDISPLRNAENLEHLNLSGNSITDVSPLSGIKKLRWLSISETNVEDMSPLDNLKLDILFR